MTRSLARASLLLGALLSLSGHAFAGLIQGVAADRAEIRGGESVNIHFRLSTPAKVTLRILDSDLETVRSFETGSVDAGSHVIAWDCLDSTGRAVPPEAYTWTIEAKGAGPAEIWEPASLYSRPIEHITTHQWDASSGTLSYRSPVPMRVWVRAGIRMGAIMATIVEGEPRAAGLVSEHWEGLDASGVVDLKERQDWVLSVFGYRLPHPSIIVKGAGPLATPGDGSSVVSRIAPAIDVKDPWWQRRRAFALADRQVPELRIEQLDPLTFAASLWAHSGALGLQRILADRVRLKWYIDGYCAAEEIDAAIPSLVTLFPDQMPSDGKRHFITANLVGAMHQVCVASKWIEAGE